MTADPVVSPADTIRRALNAVLVSDHMHSEWTCAEQALDDLAALLAAGERGRQQIARLTEAGNALIRATGTGNLYAAQVAWEAAVLADEEDARP